MSKNHPRHMRGRRYLKIKTKLAFRQGGRIVQTGPTKRRLLTPCWWCKKDFRLGQLTIDHLKPLREGGTNYQSNLVLACKPCNNGREPEHGQGQKRRREEAARLGISELELRRRERQQRPIVHYDGRENEYRLIDGRDNPPIVEGSV